MSTDKLPVDWHHEEPKERTPLMRVPERHQEYIFLYLFAHWDDPHGFVDHRIVLDAIRDRAKPVRDELVENLRILIKQIEAIDKEH